MECNILLHKSRTRRTERAWGCLYCREPKLEEDGDEYHVLGCSTHTSMADISYYLKSLPKYCSVQKWFHPMEILFHCRIFCTICDIS